VKQWLLSGWYPRGLIVHQQRYRPSDCNKHVLSRKQKWDLLGISWSYWFRCIKIKFHLICKTNTSCKLEYLSQSCILLYFITIIYDVMVGEITFDLYHISFMIVSRVWRYQMGKSGWLWLTFIFEFKGKLVVVIKAKQIYHFVSWSHCPFGFL